MEWVVYLIRASDDRLYTGITTDMARRWRQHLEGKGAKFFRGRRPAALVWLETGHDQGSALRREAAIKRLSRTAKLALVAAQAEGVEAAGGVTLSSALTATRGCGERSMPIAVLESSDSLEHG